MIGDLLLAERDTARYERDAALARAEAAEADNLVLSTGKADLQQFLSKAEARNRELEEALRPFAQFASLLSGSVAFSAPTMWAMTENAKAEIISVRPFDGTADDWFSLAHGDFRRARLLLKGGDDAA